MYQVSHLVMKNDDYDNYDGVYSDDYVNDGCDDVDVDNNDDNNTTTTKTTTIMIMTMSIVITMMMAINGKY